MSGTAHTPAELARFLARCMSAPGASISPGAGEAVAAISGQKPAEGEKV